MCQCKPFCWLKKVCIFKLYHINATIIQMRNLDCSNISYNFITWKTVYVQFQKESLLNSSFCSISHRHKIEARFNKVIYCQNLASPQISSYPGIWMKTRPNIQISSKLIRPTSSHTVNDLHPHTILVGKYFAIDRLFLLILRHSDIPQHLLSLDQ